MGRAVTGVGEEAGLLTGEGVGTAAFGVNGHAQRLIDKVIGGVAHGGDHHGHLVALLFRLNNALGHTFDRFGIGDRRTAVLLHDESHCCPLFFS